MNALLCLIAWVVLVSLSGCAEGETSYQPLGEGYRWTYDVQEQTTWGSERGDVETLTQVDSVTGTAEINGNRYWTVEST